MHLLPALQEGEFVFMRRDETKPPLSPLYGGYYRIMSQSPALKSAGKMTV